MSNPIQTPPESYLINSPEVQEVIHDNVTKDGIWQPSSVMPFYAQGTFVWFSYDRYYKKNNNPNNDIPPEDNTDDWMPFADYVAELFNIGYPSKMPQLEENLLSLLGGIYNLDQNQTNLQSQLNTVTTDLTNVKTVCTNYTDKVFVRENTINDEVLVSNLVFTGSGTSNVCKIPSPNGNVLEKWICYSNEADGYKLYIKNIADVNGSGTKITNIGGKNPRMYNNSELVYIAVDGTYKDRIMKKNAFVLSDGVAWGNNTNKAYNFCVAHNNNLVISLISTDNLDQRLHLLRTTGEMTQLTTDRVGKVDYKHGYLFFINVDQNSKLYKKSINDQTLGAILISDIENCSNLFNTIDNLLIYSSGGSAYSKRDIDVSNGGPIIISDQPTYYQIGCDLGGGEAILFKGQIGGTYLMYRKKLFIHV